jgi:hypothetical protein
LLDLYFLINTRLESAVENKTHERTVNYGGIRLEIGERKTHPQGFLIM